MFTRFTAWLSKQRFTPKWVCEKLGYAAATTPAIATLIEEMPTHRHPDNYCSVSGRSGMSGGDIML